MELTLGPLLFNWPADQVADFYRRIAEETDIDIVYLGEVVCGKRQPLLQAALAGAADRLETAGKQIIWSTLALPGTPRERRLVSELSADTGHLIEAGDMSAVWSRAPAPFVAGPLLNVYNAPAAQELMRLGCVRLCANVELSLAAISAIHSACPDLPLELFGFGRLPLALSSRCAQARAASLHRDACRYVCDQYPDGMDVITLEGASFLAINGLQTLSHGCQVIDVPVDTLTQAGVTALRLSPHTLDMVKTIALFRDYASKRISSGDLSAELVRLPLPGPLVSGYLHGLAGAQPV